LEIIFVLILLKIQIDFLITINVFITKKNNTGDEKEKLIIIEFKQTKKQN